MDFFCLPIICGCDTKLSSEGNDPRVCPRCHNVSVGPYKKREWFNLCFIPLVPYNSAHVWRCGICNWECDRNGQWQPMAPQQHQQQFGPPQGQYMQPGYGQQPMAMPPQNYQPPK